MPHDFWLNLFWRACDYSNLLCLLWQVSIHLWLLLEPPRHFSTQKILSLILIRFCVQKQQTWMFLFTTSDPCFLQVPLTCCTLSNDNYRDPEPVNVTACYAAALNTSLPDASEYINTKVRPNIQDFFLLFLWRYCICSKHFRMLWDNVDITHNYNYIWSSSICIRFLSHNLHSSFAHSGWHKFRLCRQSSQFHPVRKISNCVPTGSQAYYIWHSSICVYKVFISQVLPTLGGTNSDSADNHSSSIQSEKSVTVSPLGVQT